MSHPPSHPHPRHAQASADAAAHESDALNNAEYKRVHEDHGSSAPTASSAHGGPGVEGVDYPSRDQIRTTNASLTEKHEAKIAEEAHAKHLAELRKPDVLRDMHTLASVVSVVPGPGTIAAGTLDGLATIGDVTVGISHGDSPSTLAKTAISGALATAFDVVPVGGAIALKAVSGIGNPLTNGGIPQLVNDTAGIVGVHPDLDTTDWHKKGIDHALHAMTGTGISGGQDVSNTGGMPSDRPIVTPNSARMSPAEQQRGG